MLPRNHPDRIRIVFDDHRHLSTSIVFSLLLVSNG